MIIHVLLSLIAVVCFGTNKRSAKSISIFIVPAIGFQCMSIAGMVPADYFHLTASVINLSVIALLCLLTRGCFMAFFVGVVSLLSILSNYIGWVAYEHYQAPTAYDNSFTAMYALVLAVSIMEWWIHAGAYSDDLHVRSTGN